MIWYFATHKDVLEVGTTEVDYIASIFFWRILQPLGVIEIDRGKLLLIFWGKIKH